MRNEEILKQMCR